MRTPTEEQETTISYCRAQNAASLWTSDTTIYTKLDKLCRDAPESYQCTEVARDRDGDIISKTYRISDKHLLSFRSGRIKRDLSEEQRAALSERMRQRQGATA